ncbi:MAG: type II toxin-antitoxin system Phd/YefM family antitoxin [Chloroflexi bacterium]|nr:type II toxin-antitoxin system Phd/YefM family antitoxin [Chloroflexota bacterium]
MPAIIPATEVRDRLSAILDQLENESEPIFITRHGRARAVLLSAQLFEALSRPRAVSEPQEWYLVSQASLARIWDHPDEDVYVWEDGEAV